MCSKLITEMLFDLGVFCCKLPVKCKVSILAQNKCLYFNGPSVPFEVINMPSLDSSCKYSRGLEKSEILENLPVNVELLIWNQVDPESNLL